MSRRVRPLFAAALAAQIAALASVIVAFVLRNHVSFWQLDAPFATNSGAHQVGSDATPWLVGAGVLVVVATVLFVLDASRRTR